MSIEIEEFEAVQTYSNKAESSEPCIFTDIYQKNINIVIWKRELSQTFYQTCEQYIRRAGQLLESSLVVTPDNVSSFLCDTLPDDFKMKAYLIDDIVQVVDMFCCLFDLKKVGLRLVTLNKAMCPRFHVDRVPSRLVTTYLGEATEWLDNQCVDRNKLGKYDYPVIDNEIGMVQQFDQGDVALLKGESWQNNKGYGLVHRSPNIKPNKARLILTLDFV